MNKPFVSDPLIVEYSSQDRKKGVGGATAAGGRRVPQDHIYSHDKDWGKKTGSCDVAQLSGASDSKQHGGNERKLRADLQGLSPGSEASEARTKGRRYLSVDHLASSGYSNLSNYSNHSQTSTFSYPHMPHRPEVHTRAPAILCVRACVPGTVLSSHVECVLRSCLAIV